MDETIKQFDDWNDRKKEINIKGKGKFPRQAEIWWCSLGVNVGFEQNGNNDFERPVLILKNMSKNTCVIVPLTTSENTNRYRVIIGVIENKSVRAILSQIRIVDTKRLTNKMASLKNDTFEVIRKSVKDML